MEEEEPSTDADADADEVDESFDVDAEEDVAPPSTAVPSKREVASKTPFEQMVDALRLVDDADERAWAEKASMFDDGLDRPRVGIRLSEALEAEIKNGKGAKQRASHLLSIPCIATALVALSRLGDHLVTSPVFRPAWLCTVVGMHGGTVLSLAEHAARRLRATTVPRREDDPDPVSLDALEVLLDEMADSRCPRSTTAMPPSTVDARDVALRSNMALLDAAFLAEADAAFKATFWSPSGRRWRPWLFLSCDAYERAFRGYVRAVVRAGASLWKRRRVGESSDESIEDGSVDESAFLTRLVGSLLLPVNGLLLPLPTVACLEAMHAVMAPVSHAVQEVADWFDPLAAYGRLSGKKVEWDATAGISVALEADIAIGAPREAHLALSAFLLSRAQGILLKCEDRLAEVSAEGRTFPRPGSLKALKALFPDWIQEPVKYANRKANAHRMANEDVGRRSVPSVEPFLGRGVETAGEVYDAYHALLSFMDAPKNLLIDARFHHEAARRFLATATMPWDRERNKTAPRSWFLVAAGALVEQHRAMAYRRDLLCGAFGTLRLDLLDLLSGFASGATLVDPQTGRQVRAVTYAFTDVLDEWAEPSPSDDEGGGRRSSEEADEASGDMGGVELDAEVAAADDDDSDDDPLDGLEAFVKKIPAMLEGGVGTAMNASCAEALRALVEAGKANASRKRKRRDESRASDASEARRGRFLDEMTEKKESVSDEVRASVQTDARTDTSLGSSIEGGGRGGRKRGKKMCSSETVDESESD